MADTEDATLLQRRARRRLVGAIAVVVFVVITLPIVLDKEPGPVGQDLVIQIPSQDGGRFNTRVLPAPSPDSGAPPKSAPQAAVPPGRPSAEKSEAKSSSAAGKEPGKSPQADEDEKRARALLEGRETWFITLGTFSNPNNVKQLTAKLDDAKVKSSTEFIKGDRGDQTRVLAGPFDSRAEAEKVRGLLAAAGLQPGPVAAR